MPVVKYSLFSENKVYIKDTIPLYNSLVSMELRDCNYGPTESNPSSLA